MNEHDFPDCSGPGGQEQQKTITINSLKAFMKCQKLDWLNTQLPVVKSYEEIIQNEANTLAKEPLISLCQIKFKNGIDAHLSCSSTDQTIKKTSTLIKEPDTRTIYNAHFQFQNTQVKCDILKKRNKKWSVYLIKTSPKNHQLECSLIRFILKKLKLPFHKIYILHPCKYEKKTPQLDSQNLIQQKEIQPSNASYISSILKSIKSTYRNKECPKATLGKHCLSPQPCIHKQLCWGKTLENTLFQQKGMAISDKINLSNQGIQSLKEAANLLTLSDKQKIQFKTEESNTPHLKEGEVSSFLKQLSYPLYFLDFETFQPPLPIHNHTKSHDDIPFLYSLHIQSSKYSNLIHNYYFADPGKDPRKEMCQNLCKIISAEGSIITYNSYLETKILRDFKNLYPEYQTKLNRLISNIVDMNKLFTNQSIYIKGMKGSLSLKSIYAAFFPQTSYPKHIPKDGKEASILYTFLIHKIGSSSYLKAKENLIDYCSFDTYTMAKIISKLYNIKEHIQNLYSNQSA